MVIIVAYNDGIHTHILALSVAASVYSLILAFYSYVGNMSRIPESARPRLGDPTNRVAIIPCVKTFLRAFPVQSGMCISPSVSMLLWYIPMKTTGPTAVCLPRPRGERGAKSFGIPAGQQWSAKRAQKRMPASTDVNGDSGGCVIQDRGVAIVSKNDQDGGESQVSPIESRNTALNSR